MTQSFFVSLGLMSGTSADGIDAALIRSDGGDYVETLTTAFVPYPDDFRKRLLFCAHQHQEDDTVRADFSLWCQKACAQILAQSPLRPDFIASHGHTIDHRPDLGWTKQMDDPESLARHFGIPVVSDFRQKDMQNGGQGAPLVPVYHRVRGRGHPKPLAIVNIGGVSNITLIDEQDGMVAFDAGPGNALMDDILQKTVGARYDHGGALALSGTPHQDLAEALLSDPFFLKQGPKSLDRNHFAQRAGILQGLSLNDHLATLASITAVAIARGIVMNQPNCQECLLVGGGRKNKAIVEFLSKNLSCPVRDGDTAGFDSDFMEAEAFAYLGIRSFLGLPYSFPETTGVRVPTCGGVWTYP
ncbi:MAG: anhydro-N-acetylmuramic acid kinase [Alphaproteobacteria bacterium]